VVQALEALCLKGKGRSMSVSKPRRASVAVAETEGPVDPLAVGIRKVLLAIRKCIFKRGAYLEYLKVPSSVRFEFPVPIDLEGDGVAGEVEVPDITFGTFSKVSNVLGVHNTAGILIFASRDLVRPSRRWRRSARW
jgi:hypothetical protein